MIKTIVSPLSLSLVALLVGELLLLLSWKKFTRPQRWALGSIAAGTIILWIPSLPIVARLLLESLKGQFPPPSEIVLRKLDVIVVLSGGYGRGMDPNDDELTSDTSGRVKCGVQAFQGSGARWLVMSGSSYQGGETQDGVLMRALALKLGVPAEQVLIEPYSRSTFEHPIELGRMKEISPENRIGVATTAWHIPRAIREFKRYFREVAAISCNSPGVPLPPDPMRFMPRVEALGFSTTLLHEYLGFVWYQVRHMAAPG